MAVFRQAADPDRAGAARVQILYKAEGRGTQLIADARIGDRLSLVGPLGRPFPSIEAGERVVLVGGGTGVASLYELAAAAPDSAEVRLILGARSRNDLMGQADFAALPGRLDITTEDGSLGTKGRVTDLLGPLLESADASSGAASWLVRACGPTPMMRACADLAAAAGAACLVSLENNMACGFGVCLGCAAPKTSDGYALVCKAGPVFDAREIAWEKMP
jgi:dihydroorotate dehydrogenase electron transfer subunit